MFSTSEGTESDDVTIHDQRGQKGIRCASLIHWVGFRADADLNNRMYVSHGPITLFTISLSLSLNSPVK